MTHKKLTFRKKLTYLSQFELPYMFRYQLPRTSSAIETIKSGNKLSKWKLFKAYLEVKVNAHYVDLPTSARRFDDYVARLFIGSFGLGVVSAILGLGLTINEAYLQTKFGTPAVETSKALVASGGIVAIANFMLFNLYDSSIYNVHRFIGGEASVYSPTLYKDTKPLYDYLML